MGTFCDACQYCDYKGVVVWGREPNEAEKKLNATLEAEGKIEWCEKKERYFNKSFRKRTRNYCEEVLEESREYLADHNNPIQEQNQSDQNDRK
jgi:hypothetical protein